MAILAARFKLHEWPAVSVTCPALELLVIAFQRPSGGYMLEEIVRITSMAFATTLFAMTDVTRLVKISLSRFAHGMKHFAMNMAPSATLLLVAESTVTPIEL